MGVRGCGAAAICTVVLAAACGGAGAGGSEGMRVSLADVDPGGGHWAIRATCEGRDFRVEFRPGEQLSVSGLGDASNEEIAVECGEPERMAVSDEELRRRAATLSGADLAQPTYEQTRLSCVADGSLVVEAHPVWMRESFGSENSIGGGGFSVRRGGDTIVTGAIADEQKFEDPASQLQWWRELCRPE